MLLTKIALHNFSAFEGTQTIDLSSNGDSEKNITLIGAMNGSGKTSLLDAVKLCLYGERESGLLSPRELPAEFIIKRFNYNAQECHESEMWIELGFDGVELPGGIHQIQVRRTWKFHPVRGTYGGENQLTISRDGKELEMIDRTHWQDFINDNIPAGIAGFFFFDGEKIQQLAEDKNDREVLRDSIRNLLGLTIYSKLDSDIDKHTDDLRREANKVTDDELKHLEADEATTQRLITENREKVEELSEELYELQTEGSTIENEIRRLTSVSIDSRSELQREITEAEQQKRSANEEILKVASELMPFAIAGKLCDELRTQLEAEGKRKQWEASKERVHPQLDRIVSRVFHDDKCPRPKPDITPQQRTFYANRLTEEWEALFIPKPDDAADEVIHEVSPKDERFILNTLEKVSVQTLGTLKELLKHRERTAKRMQDASCGLRNLSEDDSHISSLFEQNKSNDARKQELNRAIALREDEHTKHERELKSIQEKIANLKKKLDVAKEDRERLGVARKVQDVLADFEKELQQIKLAELEELTTEMYRRLARKSDFVGKVKIDPHTFEVTVEDPNGRVREKRSLSAGEKQIYAISLLWGLAKASDIELPIIIDTPFARLDSEHRTKIAKHYFPHASEQVIILSTDEEIDHRYVELLSPYIGREYLIDHNDAKRHSSIKEGYFHQVGR